ncbi:hypothetical protein [Streptomyces sp. NBC_01477]|uniref:hypothetical protein n=1 Tax=Streptomyces sp. NBC_01477 TaxID=2976015 RepID=UPI002E3198DE|nr:hypothetical protein [Streptomyces sp. NBC_01477]
MTRTLMADESISYRDALQELLTAQGIEAFEARVDDPMPFDVQAWFGTVNGVRRVIYAAGQTDAFRLAITVQALAEGRTK